jgi:hypothetical protein
VRRPATVVVSRTSAGVRPTHSRARQHPATTGEIVAAARLSSSPRDGRMVNPLGDHVNHYHHDSRGEGDMGSFQWCVVDPADPDRQICEDIPVLIEPPREIPDPKNLLAEIPDSVRTDIAVLAAVDQLASSVQDEQMRSYLVDAVDEMALGLSRRMPGGAVLKRTR